MNRNSERKQRIAELENELVHKRIEVANLKLALAKRDQDLDTIRKIVGNSATIVGGGGGGGGRLQMRMRTGSDG